MLMLRPVPQSEAEARAAIAAAPAAFARALVLEAADSDDVTSQESALDYLEGRLQFFADLIAPVTAEAIRGAFRQAIREW